MFSYTQSLNTEKMLDYSNYIKSHKCEKSGDVYYASVCLRIKSHTPIIKLQRHIKKVIRRRKIIAIRKQLIPIYYAPNMKGGYFAKKEIINSLKKI